MFEKRLKWFALVYLWVVGIALGVSYSSCVYIAILSPCIYFVSNLCTPMGGFYTG